MLAPGEHVELREMGRHRQSVLQEPLPCAVGSTNGHGAALYHRTDKGPAEILA